MNRSERRRQKKLAPEPNKPEPNKTEPNKDVSVNEAFEIARQHHAAGDLEKADSFYQQILQHVPDHVHALCMLGVVSHQTGESECAIDLISRAIAIKPDFAGAYNNLGEVQRFLGRLEEARASFEKAITIEPGFSEAHNNLGALFKQAGRLDLAIESYARAISLNPDYAEPHTNLGNVYDDLGQPERAIAHHRKAISVDPSHMLSHRNLGKVLHDTGKLPEALESYRSALKINPGDGETYRQLSRIKQFEAHDDDIQAMEQVYNNPDLVEEQKMHLGFALGKAFEDLSEFDKAFDYYRDANSIKNDTIHYSLEDEAKYFARLKNVFTGALFHKHEGSGVSDNTPVFILGMPRSGTTLVEQILASHPDVYGGGELNIALDLVNAITVDQSNYYPENLLWIESQSFTNMAVYYLDNLHKIAPDAKRITDKLPGNFLQIGLIRLMLPEARIIHCQRDPMDTCLSIYKNYFAIHGHSYGYDLNTLGRYYNLYTDLMDHWRRVLPGHIYDIRYEDLVADKEPHIRALLDHCDLEWDDACLEFHKTNRSVHTASATQVRQPIYSGSVDSWKNYEKQLAPLLGILGSPPGTNEGDNDG